MGDNANLSAEDAEKIFRSTYKVLGRAIGFPIARNILKMGEDDFDSEHPTESLKAFVDNLSRAFGKEVATNIVVITVRGKFNDEQSTQILHTLNIHT